MLNDDSDNDNDHNDTIDNADGETTTRNNHVYSLLLIYRRLSEEKREGKESTLHTQPPRIHIHAAAAS